MDHEFALRLVIFEYLLPAQRTRRQRSISASLGSVGITRTWDPHRHPAGVFEDLLRFSDELLSTHGFSTSYYYPKTLQYEDSQYDTRLAVSALIDSPCSYFAWNPNCRRKADPRGGGFRTFCPGPYMALGVMTYQQR